MNLSTKLSQLTTALTNLHTKITKFKQDQQTALNLAQTRTNEANHQLELQMKENKQNEKVLEQLLKEFKEIEASL